MQANRSVQLFEPEPFIRVLLKARLMNVTQRDYWLHVQNPFPFVLCSRCGGSHRTEVCDCPRNFPESVCTMCRSDRHACEPRVMYCYFKKANVRYIALQLQNGCLFSYVSTGRGMTQTLSTILGYHDYEIPTRVPYLVEREGDLIAYRVNQPDFTRFNRSRSLPQLDTQDQGQRLHEMIAASRTYDDDLADLETSGSSIRPAPVIVINLEDMPAAEAVVGVATTCHWPPLLFIDVYHAVQNLRYDTTLEVELADGLFVPVGPAYIRLAVPAADPENEIPQAPPAPIVQPVPAPGDVWIEDGVVLSFLSPIAPPIENFDRVIAGFSSTWVVDGVELNFDAPEAPPLPNDFTAPLAFATEFVPETPPVPNFYDQDPMSDWWVRDGQMFTFEAPGFDPLPEGWQPDVQQSTTAARHIGRGWPWPDDRPDIVDPNGDPDFEHEGVQATAPKEFTVRTPVVDWSKNAQAKVKVLLLAGAALMLVLSALYTTMRAQKLYASENWWSQWWRSTLGFIQGFWYPYWQQHDQTTWLGYLHDMFTQLSYRPYSWSDGLGVYIAHNTAWLKQTVVRHFWVWEPLINMDCVPVFTAALALLQWLLVPIVILKVEHCMAPRYQFTVWRRVLSIPNLHHDTRCGLHHEMASITPLDPNCFVYEVTRHTGVTRAAPALPYLWPTESIDEVSYKIVSATLLAELNAAHPLSYRRTENVEVDVSMAQKHCTDNNTINLPDMAPNINHEGHEVAMSYVRFDTAECYCDLQRLHMQRELYVDRVNEDCVSVVRNSFRLAPVAL